jgi:hypothetical protein
LVVPPFSGGLHCGSPVVVPVDDESPVVPPFSGGLHCSTIDELVVLAQSKGNGITAKAEPYDVGHLPVTGWRLAVDVPAR